MSLRIALAAFFALVATGLTGQAQSSAPSGDAWKAMQALVGQWDSDSGGQAGQASGGSLTITSDLQGHALLRRSFAEYPATKDRPAFRHDDLTIVSPSPSGAAPKAIYYDSEGHVIEYAVSASADGHQIVWLSAVRPAEPRFRFTYILTGATTMKVRFEIAPLGQPEAFAIYVEGSLRKAVNH